MKEKGYVRSNQQRVLVTGRIIKQNWFPE